MVPLPATTVDLQIQKVITAYELVLNPTATKQARKEAENVCIFNIFFMVC